MRDHSFPRDDGPRLGGLVLSFFAVIVATAIAFAVFGGASRANIQNARIYVPTIRAEENLPAAKQVALQPFTGTQAGATGEVQTAALEPEAAASLSCNIAACSQSYRSFDASDCTFQPFDGPRRLCQR